MIQYVIDNEKYKAAILYLLNKMGKIEGKKKAYKLLYFLEFDYYEAYEKPFIGETFRSLQMGPAPIYFDGIISQMQLEKTVVTKSVRKSPLHENDTVVFLPLAENEYAFSAEEIKMLDRIVSKYGNLTGSDLEKISHEQAPYRAVKLMETIPYELSFYRETPDLV